jgi:hypothetical protein
LPVLASSAYVTIETVANLIRVLANDVIYSAAGEILTDTSTLLLPLMNDSLEWFTNEVNNHGVDTFRKETLLTPVLPIAVVDPGIQVNISDTGYFDGSINHAEPTVPTDLLVPTFLWERQTGSTEQWIEMEERPDGLPSQTQNSRLGIWEWRQDALNMLGAVQSNDIRLRYVGTQAAFATINDTLYYRGANGPIAYKTVSGYLISKNPEAAQMAASEATLRLGQLTTRNARMKQREQITRHSYGWSGRNRSFRPPSNS